ncbi:MAG TPA: helix-turn-helix domain-containing protein [Dehalococcoidia bacterium]|nr:helix-turn-helix domain-containing protein [Dehalococcoidia bacterium]
MTRDHEIAADHLPDYVVYHDEGCALFPSCLNCPLPRCRYDEPAEGGEGRRPSKMLRDEELLRQHREAGKSVAELAELFGVSRRTVQRIIRRSSTADTDRKEATT